MHSIVARQLHEYKVYLLVFVSKAWPHFVTQNTLTHVCPGEISEISFLRL